MMRMAYESKIDNPIRYKWMWSGWRDCVGVCVCVMKLESAEGERKMEIVGVCVCERKRSKSKRIGWTINLANM